MVGRKIMCTRTNNSIVKFQNWPQSWNVDVSITPRPHAKIVAVSVIYSSWRTALLWDIPLQKKNLPCVSHIFVHIESTLLVQIPQCSKGTMCAKRMVWGRHHVKYRLQMCAVCYKACYIDKFDTFQSPCVCPWFAFWAYFIDVLHGKVQTKIGGNLWWCERNVLTEAMFPHVVQYKVQGSCNSPRLIPLKTWKIESGSNHNAKGHGKQNIVCVTWQKNSCLTRISLGWWKSNRRHQLKFWNSWCAIWA